MPIKTNINSIVEELNKIPQRVENLTLQMLIEAGEEMVRIARESKTYQDRTGNLTSSIGYGVFKGHSLVAVGGFNYSKEGGSIGALSVMQEHPKLGQHNMCLVLVAGMEYAVYVERTGHVVLDGARLKSNSIMNNLLSQLKL